MSTDSSSHADLSAVTSTTATATEKEPSNADMKIPISSHRAATLTANLQSITQRIESTTSTHKITKKIRLVAVSKLKPASDILALHSSPPTGVSHLHFGENYVQELVEKSKLLPREIRWHFIGGLQSNKCTQLARDVPGLWAVESVDSIKKAKALDKGRGEARSQSPNPNTNSNSNSNSEPKDETTQPQPQPERESDPETKREKEPLRIFVQVNTSGEDSKSGVAPKSTDLIDLCKYIHGTECANLKLQGLMTIGAIARSQATTTTQTENEDFIALRENRDWVVRELGLEEQDQNSGSDSGSGSGSGSTTTVLELSMGMSEDFEGAIVQGSDEVRVGSTIFGERPPKKEAKVLENTEEEKE